MLFRSRNSPPTSCVLESAAKSITKGRMNVPSLWALPGKTVSLLVPFADMEQAIEMVPVIVEAQIQALSLIHI